MGLVKSRVALGVVLLVLTEAHILDIYALFCFHWKEWHFCVIGCKSHVILLFFLSTSDADGSSLWLPQIVAIFHLLIWEAYASSSHVRYHPVIGWQLDQCILTFIMIDKVSMRVSLQGVCIIF